MAEIRAEIPIYQHLPEYTGPGLPTPSRDAVTALANVPIEKYISYLDPNVEACLPKGSQFKGIYSHGSAYWTRTAAISTVQADGQPMNFFIKLTRTDIGKVNLMGEYSTISIMSKTVPGLTPVPLAVGTYATDEDVHFYLTSFVDMTDEVPELEQLSPRLAELHLKAVSPSGKFGFHVPTNMGACAQPNGWYSSWERCFTAVLDHMFKFEQDIHGDNPEMQQMHKVILEKVIPRLLRPLETGGNEILPRLVHGDLWDGNTSVNATTDEPIIFDASGMYAHNEYELGAWNLPRHKIYKAYIQEYQAHFPASAPEEDFEDRILLYRVRFNLTSSACYLNNMRFRDLVIEDMRDLTNRFNEGYQGAESAKAEEN